MNLTHTWTHLWYYFVHLSGKFLSFPCPASYYIHINVEYTVDLVFYAFHLFFLKDDEGEIPLSLKTNKQNKKTVSAGTRCCQLENVCHKLWVIYLCHNLSWRHHKLSCCHLYICKNTAEHFDMLSIFTAVSVAGLTCAWRGRWHWLPRGSHVCRPSHAWLKCGSKAVWGSRGAWDMRGGE